jgi:Ca2+-binding RTX toxin-like protein
MAQIVGTDGDDVIVPIDLWLIYGTGDFANGLPGDQADTVAAGLGNDTVMGAAGDDSLDGGAGTDLLIGGDDNDTLSGGDGNDTLMGGAGADLVTGGLGADIFVLSDAAGATDGGSTRLVMDRITDFSSSQGDKLAIAGLVTDITLATFPAYGE